MMLYFLLKNVHVSGPESFNICKDMPHGISYCGGSPPGSHKRTLGAQHQRLRALFLRGEGILKQKIKLLC